MEIKDTGKLFSTVPIEKTEAKEIKDKNLGIREGEFPDIKDTFEKNPVIEIYKKIQDIIVNKGEKDKNTEKKEETKIPNPLTDIIIMQDGAPGQNRKPQEILNDYPKI